MWIRLKQLFGRGWEELVSNVCKHSGRIHALETKFPSAEKRIDQIERRLAEMQRQLDGVYVESRISEKVKTLVRQSPYMASPSCPETREQEYRTMIAVENLLAGGKIQLSPKGDNQ